MTGAGHPLAVLGRARRAAATPPPPPPPLGELCELCHVDLRTEWGMPHGHLVDLHERSLACACRACYLLFTQPRAGGRYRAVPERYLSLPDLNFSAADWDTLGIPVDVAFFFMNSELERVAAFYPGPAGATESLLALDAWDAIVADLPVLASLDPDVEAFLVRGAGRRGGDGKVEGFVVPIDACYELVGHLRRLWQGFDGGKEANDAIDAFFARLQERSVPADAGTAPARSEAEV